MSFGLLNRRELVCFIAIIAVFISLHFVGLDIPYHQDEYKWPEYANPQNEAGAVVHPPLAEFVYRQMGPAVGYDNFRTIPFMFGLINLFLIFCLSNLIFDKKSALWAAFLFSVSFFSLLASLMVDVDGAVMPAFFLVMSIGYFQLRKKNFQFAASDFQGWVWVVLLAGGAIGGFLVKVSGILPIGAIFLDFLIEKRIFNDKKRVFKYISLGILGLLGLVATLFVAKLVFPFFPIEKSWKYWLHFANSSSFLGRGWLQTFIQFAKSVMYVSPLLVLPALFTDKEIWRKARPFFLFIFVGLVFYLAVFDFSIGALDRYLQFLIVPLCIIAGAVFSGLDIKELKPKDWIWPVLISFSVFSVQFFGHSVPPLYPKAEWLARLFSLKWNFLFPFTGGSGPLPFYVSFLFIGLLWAASVAATAVALKKTEFKRGALLAILVFGLLYNSVFTEEYLFGKINGSASKLVRSAAAFIQKSDEIKKVTVYNDNGGYDIIKTGKYRKRLYIDPKFDLEEKIKSLNQYKEHYMVVEIPRIDASTVYAKYFSSCRTAYRETDKTISAAVYDCRQAPDIKNK